MPDSPLIVLSSRQGPLESSVPSDTIDWVAQTQIFYSLRNQSINGFGDCRRACICYLGSVRLRVILVAAFRSIMMNCSVGLSLNRDGNRGKGQGAMAHQASVLDRGRS